MPTAHEALAGEASPSESRTEGPAAPAPKDDASVRRSVARQITTFPSLGDERDGAIAQAGRAASAPRQDRALTSGSDIVRIQSPIFSDSNGPNAIQPSQRPTSFLMRRVSTPGLFQGTHRFALAQELVVGDNFPLVRPVRNNSGEELPLQVFSEDFQRITEWVRRFDGNAETAGVMMFDRGDGTVELLVRVSSSQTFFERGLLMATSADSTKRQLARFVHDHGLVRDILPIVEEISATPADDSEAVQGLVHLFARISLPWLVEIRAAGQSTMTDYLHGGAASRFGPTFARPRATRQTNPGSVEDESMRGCSDDEGDDSDDDVDMGDGDDDGGKTSGNPSVPLEVKAKARETARLKEVRSREATLATAKLSAARIPRKQQALPLRRMAARARRRTRRQPLPAPPSPRYRLGLLKALRAHQEPG